MVYYILRSRDIVCVSIYESETSDGSSGDGATHPNTPHIGPYTLTELVDLAHTIESLIATEEVAKC